MRLLLILLLVLGLFRAGFGFVLLTIVLAIGFRVILNLVLFGGFVVLIVLNIGIVAELIAVAEILNDLTCKFREGALIAERIL